MTKHFRLPTLLVVADNPSVRFWVKKHLDDQFFIISAERRQGALEALDARLDFIIVDSAFEDCDALELCKELSRQTQKYLVPILLITGRLKKSYRDRALESGVTDFLSDQLDADELETRIATGLKAASVRQKTEDLGLSIKLPQIPSNASLKKKVLLNDPALRFLAKAKKEKKPIALLFLRIDEWDKMELQSEILPSFTKFIQRFLREGDLLLPSLENGSILFLSNTTADGARTIAEILRVQIQKIPFATSKGPQHLTVSIAISSLETSEKGVDRMIHSAAKLLQTHPETNLILSLDQEAP